MTILVGVNDEFLDWLNECPVQWKLLEQKDGSLIYEFEKESDEECEHSWVDKNNDGLEICRFCNLERGE